MSHYGLHGGRGRRDANESLIVDTLRAAGCLVVQIDTAAVGDLLVWPRRKGSALAHCWLLEVKSKNGKLSPSQALWAEQVEKLGIRYAVVRSADEALAAIKGKGKLK